MTTSELHALRLVKPSPSPGEFEVACRPLMITVRSGTDIHGLALVILAGEIDDSGAARLQAMIAKLVSEQRRYILLDLDELAFRDAQAYEDMVEGACRAVAKPVTVFYTSDPRCLLLLRIEDHPSNTGPAGP